MYAITEFIIHWLISYWKGYIGERFGPALRRLRILDAVERFSPKLGRRQLLISRLLQQFSKSWTAPSCQMVNRNKTSSRNPPATKSWANGPKAFNSSST